MELFDTEKNGGCFVGSDNVSSDSAYSSRKNSSIPQSTPGSSSGSKSYTEYAPDKPSGGAVANYGAEVTRAQQWRILIATSLQAFWILGLSQSFGIWQRHYGSTAAVGRGIIQSDDMTRRAMIAAIGSLGNGGVVAAFGMLYYPYLPLIGKHVRSLCCFGTGLITGGFALAIASNHLWHVLLTQGLLVGIGCGIFLYTLTPILPEYFVQHSGVAQGIVVAGSAGGTALSLITPSLLDALGPRGTLGIFAATSLVICSIVSLLAQPPRKFERRSTKLVTWRTFKDPIFTLLFLANFIHPLTIAIPMTFGPEFSESLGYSDHIGSILLAIGSAVGFPARLVNGYVADRIGHLNMLCLATAVYAIGSWGLWLSAAHWSSGTLWIVFSVLYGIINGTFTAVINSVQRRLFGDELYYPYNGAMTSIRGIGYVLGVPIAGSLVSRVKDVELHAGDFTRPIVYTGVLLALAVVFLTGVRGLDAKKNGWQWAR